MKTRVQQWVKKRFACKERSASAAIEIQRVFRGYCTRCRLTSLLHPDLSKEAVYSTSRPLLQRTDDMGTPSRDKLEQVPCARERLEQYHQKYVDKKMIVGTPHDEISTFEDFCASYIQNWWRTLIANRNEQSSKEQQKIKVTTSFGKPKEGEKKNVRIPSSMNEAATMIQRAWRRHIDVQVYRYYRDLINFRQKGDPSMMLRCINPTEAKYLDAAAGIHIKFRLAGDRFPPNIYYKIFTHHSVQDMCANSPKNYTSAFSKAQLPRDLHNKGSHAPIPGQDKAGWYERIENNGWRLVSDRLIHSALSDPVTWDSSRKKVEFHHNKLQRREDVERKKKKKKIEWMQKMYKQGMLKAKSEDEETITLIDGAAAGMIATVDAHGHTAVQDWEVDELLDWTTSLNFDDYWSTWKELATSSSSKKAVDDRLGLASGDPFEIEMNSINSKQDTSTHLSRNTPVSSQSPSLKLKY